MHLVAAGQIAKLELARMALDALQHIDEILILGREHQAPAHSAALAEQKLFAAFFAAERQQDLTVGTQLRTTLEIPAEAALVVARSQLVEADVLRRELGENAVGRSIQTGFAHRKVEDRTHSVGGGVGAAAVQELAVHEDSRARRKLQRDGRPVA